MWKVLNTLNKNVVNETCEPVFQNEFAESTVVSTIPFSITTSETKRTLAFENQLHRMSRNNAVCVRTRFHRLIKNIWDKVFKTGPSKINLSRPLPFNFFKGCLPQVLLGPLLNTFSHIKVKTEVVVVLKQRMHCYFIIH